MLPKELILDLFGSPFGAGVSHVLWRFDRGYEFKHAVTEPDYRDDSACDYSNGGCVK